MSRPGNTLRDVTFEYQRHRTKFEQAMARGNTERADDAMSDMREMERDITIIDTRRKKPR